MRRSLTWVAGLTLVSSGCGGVDGVGGGAPAVDGPRGGSVPPIDDAASRDPAPAFAPRAAASTARGAFPSPIGSEPKLVATIPGTSGMFFGFPLAFDGKTINADGDLVVADGAAWKSAGDFPLKVEGFPYTAVAVSGDTAIVAASGYYGGGGQAVFISRASGAWKKQQIVAEPTNDAFAAAVAVSGDTAIIGASATTNDFATPVDELGAHVFKQHGGAWTEETKLTSGTGASDGFGAALAIDGATLVVGAPHTMVGENEHQGAAYVFDLSGASPRRVAKLVAEDGAADVDFGAAVAIDGDTILVGAPLGYQPGVAYVFTRSGDAWSQEAKLTVDGLLSGDSFGLALAVSGDLALVGAPVHSPPGQPFSGSAFAFARTGSSWTMFQEFDETKGGVNDYFGGSLAVVGTTAIIDAPSQGQHGEILVYDLTPSNASGGGGSTSASGGALTATGGCDCEAARGADAAGGWASFVALLAIAWLRARGPRRRAS